MYFVLCSHVFENAERGFTDFIVYEPVASDLRHCSNEVNTACERELFMSTKHSTLPRLRAGEDTCRGVDKSKPAAA
jgi:hypothetical protein